MKPSDYAYFYLKLPCSIKNSLRIHEIFQKSAGFHWIFECDFFKFSRFGGLRPPPQPRTNAGDRIFLNYWRNFREKFDKIL